MDPNNDQIEPFIDIAEAAEFLRRSRKTIRAWARAGINPAHPIGTGPASSFVSKVGAG